MGIHILAERSVLHTDYMEIVYRRGHDHFTAFTRYTRTRKGTIHAWNNRKVDPARYCPKAPADVMIAPAELLPTCYIKHQFPNLWPEMGLGTYDPKECILREVGVYKILAKNPHPHIAKYVGCIIEDGFIKGIAYEKYVETLTHKVNPHGLSKRCFQYGEHRLEHGREVLIAQVTKAIHHLHSLSICSNDVKTDNIMLDCHRAAILIDFDSCLPIGASCVDVGRTPGWCDFDMEISEPGNDLLALAEIREWLSDTPPEMKRYIFDDDE